MPNKSFELFGWSISRTKPMQTPSPVTPPITGASVVTAPTAAYGYYGYSYDIDGMISNEHQLINRYREVSTYPDCDQAIEQIVNEAVIVDQSKPPVSLNVDNVKLSKGLKKKILEEFDNILKLTNFNENCHDIFKRWYIDGRSYFYVVIDEKHPTKGILDVKYIDNLKIREVQKITKENRDGIEVVTNVERYYIFNDNGLQNSTSCFKLSPDTIVDVKSGLVDANSGEVISFLFKAIKPVNQLRMMEDAVVIYRISRAPERRIFYVDVANLQPARAEQYVQDMMNKFRNKIVYDPVTGEIKNNRNYLSMCLAMDTKVPLLDGRTLTIEEIAKEYKDHQLWAYSCDPQTGEFKPGKITWAGVTRKDQPVMRVTLDNGKSITCTPDHKFPVREGGFVEAQDLVVGQSLMPFYTRTRSIAGGEENKKESKHYLQIYQNDTNKWAFVHRLVSQWKDEVGLDNSTVFDEAVAGTGRWSVVHHRDFNKFNNNPENLTKVDERDHYIYHSRLVSEQPTEHQRHFCENYGELGRATLAKKLQDPEWNAWFRNQQRKGWTPELRDKWSEQAKRNGLGADGKGAEAVKKLFADPEYVAKRNKKYQTEYAPEHFNAVEQCAIKGLTLNATIDVLNHDHQLIKSLKELNTQKVISAKQKRYDRFCKEDVYRIIKQFSAFTSYRDFRDSFVYHNHKVTKIEYLDGTMDVGCLTIDGNEEFHNFHTFATDAGVYVKNCEDFWLPRREGGRSTEIQTLPGGQNLGDIVDIEYFQRKLYQSMNVPLQRLLPDNNFSLGRSNEITREEILFSKFVQRLRNNFNTFFFQLLKLQLIAKRIIRADEWEELRSQLFVEYQHDNYFEELKRNEIFRDRMELAQQADGYKGVYFSKEYIAKNILQFTEPEWEKMKKEMAVEAEEENGNDNFGDNGEDNDSDNDSDNDTADNQGNSNDNSNNSHSPDTSDRQVDEPEEEEVDVLAELEE